MAMGSISCVSGAVGVAGNISRSIQASVNSSSRSSLYGNRVLPSLSRPRSAANRRKSSAPSSPSLICVAVVWWSDASRQIQPDWQKLQKLRTEKFAGRQGMSEEPLEAINTPSLESLKSGLKNLFSMGFSPEVIIGRIAMVGFLAATTVEVETGKSVLQQLTFRGDIFAAVVTVGVLLMSLRRKEDGGDGLFNPSGLFSPTAERLNGQAAMLGFALLIVIESAKGSALF